MLLLTTLFILFTNTTLNRLGFVMLTVRIYSPELAQQKEKVKKLEKIIQEKEKVKYSFSQLTTSQK